MIQFGVANVTDFGDLTFEATTFPPGPLGIPSTTIHAGDAEVTLVGFTGTLTASDFIIA